MRLESLSGPLFGRRFARQLWMLLRVYWVSSDAVHGALLLLLAVGLELGAVYGNVLLADSQRRIFDSVQGREIGAFFTSLESFSGVLIGFLLVSTYRVYVRQFLEMNWRRSLTGYFVKQWIDPATYGQAELHPGVIDNPDQRVAEDVRVVVASALGLSLSLLAAAVTFFSFAGVLWGLSAHFPVPFAAPDSRIPGLMLWVAITYAVAGTGLTHVVGRRLIPLGVDKQRVEADFRYGLVRFRENVLPVAHTRGEATERDNASSRFDAVVGNWRRLISAQRNLSLVTTGLGQASGLVPLLIGAPAYFAGHFTLGSLVQTRIAYEQVVGSLAWFVYAYQEIAQWRASVERLTVLASLIDTTRSELSRMERIRVEATASQDLEIADVRIDLPDGRVLLDHVSARISPGERIAVIGPPGSGKTILFRALAGTWLFGRGVIRMPAPARQFFLPQRPYLPSGTLRDIICYPRHSDEFTDAEVLEVLRTLDLAGLVDRFHGTGSWEQHLSADELQRFGFARALLHEPDWLFVDDATAAVTPSAEKRIYDVLADRLPHATILTLTHRDSIARYHTRCWTIAPGGDGMSSLQVN